jgi:hypothetical protein
MLKHLKTLNDLSAIRLQATDKVGIVDAMFQEEIKKVIGDMYDRATISASRQITIGLHFTPVVDGQGGLVEIKTSFEVHSKLPRKRTREISMATQGGEGFKFNDAAPENVHQGTLDQLPPATPEAK